MLTARALTVALGLLGREAWAGDAAQDASCSRAGDCPADSDTAELLQLRKESPSGTYKLQSYSGWDGVNAEDGLPASVTAVQDQGNCGSCAAFSAIGQLGTRLAKANKDISGILSAQATLWGGQHWGYGGGCDGAFPSNYGTMYGKHGVPDETCAPYRAGKTCLSGSDGADYGCLQMDWGTCYGSGSWTDYGLALTVRKITADAESEMMKEILDNGPVSACLNVYENFFNVPAPLEQNIYTQAEGSLAGGHAIVLTGWGDVEGTAIWLLKNSWGTGWGTGGYCMFLRGSNLCDIESYEVSAFSVSSVQAPPDAGMVQGSNTSSPEASEGMVPGGWYAHSTESGLWKELVDAWMLLSGYSEASEAPAVLSVHTRVANGVGAKLTLDLPEGERGAGAGANIVQLLKPITAFQAGRGAGVTNGWAIM